VDARITKARFKEHWNYDWFKYLLIVIGAFVIFSLLYSITAPALQNREEFEVLVHTWYYNKETTEQKRGELYDLLSGNNVEIKNVLFSCYTNNDVNSKSFIYSNVEYEYRMTMKLPDVTIMQYLEEHTSVDDEGNVGYKTGHGYSFEFWVSQDYYVPIDELLNAEIERGNTLATDVLQRLMDGNLFYSFVKVAYADDASQEPTAVDDAAKNWGIDLNKLDLSKFELWMSDGNQSGIEGADNTFCYALGILSSTENRADTVIFLDWLLDNYAK